MSKWLVPFKGRHHSGEYKQNFLWQSDSIYIMDNHRAALWCWFQYLEKDNTYNLFHMDRHSDTLYSRIDEWKELLPDLWQVSLEDYLELKYNCGIGNVPVIRFDNYLSLFLELYSNLIGYIKFATHGCGERPKVPEGCGFFDVHMWDAAENLGFWLSREATPNESKWIFNLDLDYFFCDSATSRMLMVSDDYLATIFESIAQKYQEGRIAVLTVSLSPEYCGNWQQAEELCSRFCSTMGLSFRLPAD